MSEEMKDESVVDEGFVEANKLAETSDTILYVALDLKEAAIVFAALNMAGSTLKEQIKTMEPGEETAEVMAILEDHLERMDVISNALLSKSSYGSPSIVSAIEEKAKEANA